MSKGTIFAILLVGILAASFRFLAPRHVKSDTCHHRIATSLAATNGVSVSCWDGDVVVRFESTPDFVHAAGGSQFAYDSAKRDRFDIGLQINVREPTHGGRPTPAIVSKPENLRLGVQEAPFGFAGPRPVLDRVAIDGPFWLAAASKLEPVWFDPEVNAFYGDSGLPGCTVTFDVDERVAEIIVPCNVMGPLARRIVRDARRGLRAWSAPPPRETTAPTIRTERRMRP